MPLMSPHPCSGLDCFYEKIEQVREQYLYNLSQSLQKPTLLDLISSHQNVTSEFGVRVRDSGAVVMSLKLSFPCPLDKFFSKCVMAAPPIPGMASSSSVR